MGSISKRVILILLAMSISHGLAETMQLPFLHPGNGNLLKNVTMEIDSNGFIMTISDSGHAKITGRNHVTPLFIDLNIYTDVEFRSSRKKLLQRGINYILLERSRQLFFHNIVTGSDSLMGYYLDMNNDSLSVFALSSRWYDTFACLHYSDLSDSLILPWDVGLSASVFLDILENDSPLWVNLNDAWLFKSFDGLCKSNDFPVIYYGLSVDPLPLGIDSISAVLDWELGRNYLLGDYESDSEYHILNYDLNFAVRIPRFQSFWEFLLFANNTLKQDLNDEEVLQILTVQPAQFLGLTQILLEPGAPANMVRFSTEPFSLRSRIISLMYLNQKIFQE